MKKIGKILMGSLTLPAVVVPMTTLASCGQAWAHATPMYIGSINDGPYADLNEDSYSDRDGIKIVSYLQDNYTVQKSSNTNYGYSTPYKFEDDPEREQREPAGWKPANVGWYTSGDGAFVTSAKDEWKVGGETKSAVRYSARNATLSQNIDYVCSIGSTISSYIDLALNYSTTQVHDNNVDCDEDIKTAWGGQLNHGEKGGSTKEQNNKFYEFLFALANLVNTEDGKNISMLKTSHVDFKFNTMPLPSYSFSTNARVDFSDSFKILLEGNTDVWRQEKPSETLRYYTKASNVQTEKVKEGDVEKEYKYINYTYEYVPIIIHTTEYKKTYLNVSKKANSYLVNDYYANDNDVTKTVGNLWKGKYGIHNYTDIEDTNATPSYKEYDLKVQSNPKQVVTSKDERIDDEQIHGCDFIGLMSYSVNLYNADSAKEITENHPERNSAIILGLNYLFPAYLIDLYGDELYKDLKTDGPKVFDRSKIENHNLALLNLWNRSSKEGKKPHARDLSEDSKKLLKFLTYMFGNNTSLNTNDFLTPGQPISKQ